jgi:2-polyprenyl-3-methyl-5-hydroxy-6-metoxy-1,4-benzoquinol methylase
LRLFGKLLAPWRSYGQTVFRGDWAYRLEGLFESGIDFSGKRILDAGCNVGIVAYEVAKQGPASIHGVDYFPAFIETARHVFHGYRSLPHRFDVLDLTKQRQVDRILATEYDIVIFMAVWQHIYERHGQAVAEQIAVDLARRCAGTFIARTAPLALADAFSRIMRREGFELVREWRGARSKTGERILAIYGRV